MSLLFCSFLMLVCRGENRSARMTTLASSPFELWIVITLTAFVGGVVDASMACELLSLRSRSLSERTIGSPPTSAVSVLIRSTNCSASCLETLSGYATSRSERSMVSSRSSTRLEELSSRHLDTNDRCLSLEQFDCSLESRSSPFSELERKSCSWVSVIPNSGERATHAALCLDPGLATSWTSPSNAAAAGRSSNPPSRSTCVGTPRSCRCLMMTSLRLTLFGRSIVISSGLTASSGWTEFHELSADLTLTGLPSMRLLTLSAMSVACLSNRSSDPGPKGSRWIRRSVAGSVDPSESGGHIHSIEPGFCLFSGNEWRVWDEA